MAGTIISTPATGASDWTDFITQQGATDTGYMRVSLTNFSGTVASAIATGSVLECAGSIYTFTETAISLASGTASADVAVYYTVIPSAGGTTVSVVMDDTTPVWVDAKQGFYLSAASLTRAIGGCYIDGANQYKNKFLYTGENLDYCHWTGNTRPLLKEILDIGEWNMDATASKTLYPTGKTTKIYSVTVAIHDDGANQIENLDTNHGTPSVGTGYWILNDSTNALTLYRIAGGQFDGPNWDGTASTIANRGFVFIVYEA